MSVRPHVGGTAWWREESALKRQGYAPFHPKLRILANVEPGSRVVLLELRVGVGVASPL